MDWLAQYYASLDCHEKVLIFRIPNNEEFRFRSDKSSMPQNLISEITSRKMLRRGCKGYLAMVRDTKVEIRTIEKMLVVCEFPDFFLKNYQDYHQIER